MVDNATVWRAVMGEMEIGLSKQAFQTWFKDVSLIEGDDASTAKVSVPNVFIKNQFEDKFKPQVIKLLNTHGLKTDDIEFVINGSAVSSKSNRNKSRVSVAQSGSKPTKNSVFGTQTSSQNNLNPKYTFDSYIVGSSNELAYTACSAAAKDPGSKYNPLFIYGGVGLGKTHLIQAVGNEIIKNIPGTQVMYISAEAFLRDFVDSIRNKKVFTDKYRKTDVLIIDDIQFIGTAEKTQEEFFHTFNELHQNNKQVILSCDKQPKSIPTLTERLQSRFEWGMTIDIQQPDYETRCAILQAKARASGFNLPRETAEYLAANIQTNIRELEGALNQLVAFCEIRSLPPDLQTAKALLTNIRVRPKHISSKDVVSKVAKHFGIEEDEIKGPKRSKDIVVPRQVAMYLLRNELKMSFPQIALALGKKDHTTAMHSFDKINKLVYTDGFVRQNVNEIKDLLYA